MAGGRPKGYAKTGGKKKGSKNLKSLQWEALGHALLTQHSGRANEILKNCDDDVFMDNYSKLLEYFKPKLARSEVKQEGSTEINIVFNRQK